MEWQPEIDEIAHRKALAAHLGGEERVARQRSAGKLTCRERIDRLLDVGSFREIGSLTGWAERDGAGTITAFTPANFVGGRGEVDGRPVMVGADDFTVRGGHADAGIHRKQIYLEQLSRELRIPMVRLIDGSSGGGSVKTYEEEGRTYVPPLPGFEHQVRMLSEVPVAAAVLGPVVGLGAARAVLSHHSVMVREIGQVFVAGPPVVAYATGEEVDKEALGGAGVHGGNGTVDDLVASEEEAFDRIRRFLSYLPSSVWELPPAGPPPQGTDRPVEELGTIVPRDRRRPYPVRRLLDLVLDEGSLLEIGRGWGRSTVTALARLAGHPVAVLASDPMHWGGALTADGSNKLRRMVDLADTFHLPVVSLVDQPGFAIGTAAERASTIRHGAAAIAALYQASVPWFSVIVRRAFGVAGAALVDRGDPDVRMAWPSADWGSLPLEGGIEAAFRRDLAAAEDAGAMRDRLMVRFEALRSPLRTAEAFGIEEVIDPRDTRRLLCEWIRIAVRRLPERLGPTGRGHRP
jgi:acetyl-CoA carboxylase carboxyltransferase component